MAAPQSSTVGVVKELSSLTTPIDSGSLCGRTGGTVSTNSTVYHVLNPKLALTAPVVVMGTRTRPCHLIWDIDPALQAGYLMCEAEEPGAAPLHCVVRIVPAQVAHLTTPNPKPSTLPLAVSTQLSTNRCTATCQATQLLPPVYMLLSR